MVYSYILTDLWKAGLACKLISAKALPPRLEGAIEPFLHDFAHQNPSIVRQRCSFYSLHNESSCALGKYAEQMQMSYPTIEYQQSNRIDSDLGKADMKVHAWSQRNTRESSKSWNVETLSCEHGEPAFPSVRSNMAEDPKLTIFCIHFGQLLSLSQIVFNKAQLSGETS